MISSIPKTAYELGFSFQNYEDLAKNLRRMMLIPHTSRQNIIDEANLRMPKSKLSKNLTDMINALIKDLENESSDFYELAGLDYKTGPDKPQNIFTEAVLDYLLRNQDKVEN